MTYNAKTCRITPIYKQLNYLKIEDIYKLELGKFMYLTKKVKNTKLPNALFTKINSVHHHSTRSTTLHQYFLLCMSASPGEKSLASRGVLLWAKLDHKIKEVGW